ncbi:MAG: pilus assembly protein PilX [Methylococcaceae bacterium]|nr:MAG: pilus assembly protein PilX [Methylococcaceae bacterium]
MRRRGSNNAWKRVKKCRIQRGAALIASLVFLLIMTLIGVTGLQVSSMEEKMTGNMRDRDLAFQAAESALRAGETFMTAATLPAFDGTSGHYATSAAQPAFWDSIDWSDPAQTTTYSGGALSNVYAAPAYIIEQLPATADAAAGSSGSLEAGIPPAGGNVSWYRITARGMGGTAQAVVVLQSIYRR